MQILYPFIEYNLKNMDGVYIFFINFHKIFNFTLVAMNKDGLKAIGNNSGS